MTIKYGKAIFLDRDGTINIDKGYIHKVEDFKFIPKTTEALSLLQMEYKLIIITNQSGINRGYYSKEDMNKVNNYMLKELSKAGVNISKVYYNFKIKPKFKKKKEKSLILRRT